MDMLSCINIFHGVIFHCLVYIQITSIVSFCVNVQFLTLIFLVTYLNSELCLKVNVKYASSSPLCPCVLILEHRYVNLVININHTSIQRLNMCCFSHSAHRQTPRQPDWKYTDRQINTAIDAHKHTHRNTDNTDSLSPLPHAFQQCNTHTLINTCLRSLFAVQYRVFNIFTFQETNYET